ncbi:MAG: hypothetical protein AAGA08_17035 [Pseudomonadota bacterium]
MSADKSEKKEAKGPSKEMLAAAAIADRKRAGIDNLASMHADPDGDSAREELSDAAQVFMVNGDDLLTLAEQQQARIKELEEALKPFAEATLLSASESMGFAKGCYYAAGKTHRTVTCSMSGTTGQHVADVFNRARAALEEEQ